MLRMMGKRRKLQNKGMTLIEVIVAMAILAIVIAPTLRMFASSSSVNLRAKYSSRATVVGEGVMESFKAYSLTDLCSQFEKLYPVELDHTTFQGVGISADASQLTTTKLTVKKGASVISPWEDDTAVIKKLNYDATEYLFEIKNAAIEGDYYNVEVEVTPRSTAIVKALKMDQFNPYTDAIIEIPEGQVDEAVNLKLVEMLESKLSSYTPGDMRAGGSVSKTGDMELLDVKRAIFVEAYDDSSADKVKISVEYTCSKAKCSYKYPTLFNPNKSATWTYEDTSDPVKVTVVPAVGLDTVEWNLYTPDDTITDEGVLYDNTNTIAGQATGLRNIYFYYYPMYKKTVNMSAGDTSVSAKDELTFSNSAGDKVNVYITKQMPTAISGYNGIADDAAFISEEESYFNFGFEITGDSNMYVYSNTYPNLFNPASARNTGAIDCDADHIDGFADFTGGGNAKSLGDDIVQTKVLLYDVTVHVYSVQSGLEVATYVGTVNN